MFAVKFQLPLFCSFKNEWFYPSRGIVYLDAGIVFDMHYIFWILTLSLSLKCFPKKIGAWFVLYSSFFWLKLYSVFIKLPFVPASNIVAISGFLVLIATWIHSKTATVCVLWKNGLRCFLLNFAKFLRTPFLRNNSGQLLLYIPQNAEMGI